MQEHWNDTMKERYKIFDAVLTARNLMHILGDIFTFVIVAGAVINYLEIYEEDIPKNMQKVFAYVACFFCVSSICNMSIMLRACRSLVTIAVFSGYIVFLLFPTCFLFLSSETTDLMWVGMMYLLIMLPGSLLFVYHWYKLIDKTHGVKSNLMSIKNETLFEYAASGKFANSKDTTNQS